MKSDTARWMEGPRTTWMNVLNVSWGILLEPGYNKRSAHQFLFGHENVFGLNLDIWNHCAKSITKTGSQDPENHDLEMGHEWVIDLWKWVTVFRVLVVDFALLKTFVLRDWKCRPLLKNSLEMNFCWGWFNIIMSVSEIWHPRWWPSGHEFNWNLSSPW